MTFQDRVVGALKLRPHVFEEVEHDQTATAQAALVVAAGAFSGGLATRSMTGIVLGVIISLIGWAIGAGVLLLVGTRLFPGRSTEADMGQMLRTLGFAQAPMLFSVLRVVPLLGRLVQLGLWVWVLVAMVIAVRQALDYEDTGRAVLVCVVAWLIMLVVNLVVAFLGIGSAVIMSNGL